MENNTVEENDDLDWLDELLDELLYSDDGEAELVAQGSTAEDAREWKAVFSTYTPEELELIAEDDEELLALLDAPFKVLRDDTFPDPDRLLVWDRQETPSVQALTFKEATERYQCGGVGSRWVPDDLETVKEVKRECLEETLSSYSKREEDPSYEGVCSTPALVVSNNPSKAHRWCVVKANLSPEE